MKSSIAGRVCTKVKTVNGPFSKYLGRFQNFLENQGYSQARIYQYVVCIAVLDRAVKEAGVKLKNLDEDEAIKLLQGSDSSEPWKQKADFIARNFMKFLAGLGLVKPDLGPEDP